VHSVTLTPAPTVVNTFANEFYKTKSSDDIEQNKMAMLEAKIKVVKGVDLYNLVQVVKMCLIPNMVLPKKFLVFEFIKYTMTQCPITHLKFY